MVSPSKTKYSRVAANQQHKTATNKVKLVKGPRPLIYHRFYLDVQNFKLANKIDLTIKELGGKIEFFLNKEITHFITDKEYHHRPQQNPAALDLAEGTPSSHQESPATPTTPLTPRTPLSHPYHHLQYVNEASPSSPCVSSVPGAAAAAIPSASASGSAAAIPTGNTARINTGSEYKDKPVPRPRSRADAMLQRARQSQNQTSNNNHSSASNNRLSSTSARSRPDSPCSPAPVQQPPISSFRLDRNSQSPVQLAKSWGKPIWSTEYAIKFLKKVIETCKADPDLYSLPKSSSAAAKKATNLQHLRGDFVKIESFQRHHRPAFQLFKKWPWLRLNAKATSSPFDSEKDKSVPASVVAPAAASNKIPKEATTTRVENSVKTTATTNATAKQQTNLQQQCGYCEICRIEYDVLANHLITEEHSAFVNNDANFVALDKLISDGGVGLETFLSANKKLVEEELVVVAVVEKESEESVDSGTCEDNVVRNEWEEAKSVKVLLEPLEYSSPKEVRPSSEATTVPKALRTYSKKKSRDKHSPQAAPKSDIAGASDGSSTRSPPAKRTYAGRRSAQSSPAAASKPEAVEKAAAAAAASTSSTVAAEPQMFGRRSAIHHHPHNTLNHHNHQKAKTAKLVQQAILNSATKELAAAAAAAAAVVESKESAVDSQQPRKAKAAAAVEAEANAMKVLNDNSSTSEKEKERHLKRSVADKMGLKGSTMKPVSHPVELLECDGLDPKNTKRISLGLRQNPKRANLNEDFTSLLDETLGPMRKPRVRRESAKRVNYSEPREDEIASQEEIMESILLESTAKNAAASENGTRKKAGGSPKRQMDVKIRGIRWRAPSPQARPPVKSPLLYKVIEQPKAKTNKKTTSPVKDATNTGGSPSKSNKNGLIVKIRRVRQSELSLLNDEAENFMFPKKDESSEEETDEDRQTTSETGPGDYSLDVPSSDFEHRNSSMRRSAGTPAPPTRKRAASVAPTCRSRGGSPSKKHTRGSDQEYASTPKTSGTKQQRRPNRGAAALLHDNAEYYKFPDPGSRLRFPEAPIQPDSEVELIGGSIGAGASTTPRAVKGKKRGRRGLTPGPSATVTSSSSAEKQKEQLLLGTRSSPTSPYQHQELLSNCGKTIINYVKGKEDGMGVFKWSNFNRNCKLIEPYRFAFERVPSLEPWYETFQRQDESSEKMYEYFGNTAYRKLPYEMGPLPPLRQNCCILNYRMKSKTPESTVPASSESSTSGSTCNLANTSNRKASAASAALCSTPDANAEDDDKRPLSLPLKKRKHLIDADRPRKSPREHASTLAILSLLHQQQQHNRRRTFSGGFPFISPGSLPPPSPVYSPKKVAIQQQKQQEADSALGDEIRSSCGSDPITEKDASSELTNKIKFDPPVLEDTYVNYKVMCQELENFLDDEANDELLGVEPSSEAKLIPIGLAPNAKPIKRDLCDILQSCDKDPPLSLKLVSRHESIVRKIVQYDRKPRPLAAVSIKSFDGGGSLGFFKKRINRTGWPNVKKRIVTRKQQQQQQQQQQQLLTVKKEDGTEEEVKKDATEADGSRKSSTEESQLSGITTVEKMKQEDEDDDDDEEDEDEFEDTMTMLDDEERSMIRPDQTISDVEEVLETPKKPVVVEPPRSPIPSQIEEIIIPNRTSCRPPLPSSKYVTKTTTTMTRIDYNVTVPSEEQQAPQAQTQTQSQPPPPLPIAAVTTNHCRIRSTSHSNTASVASPGVCPPVATVTVNSHHQHEDDDKECDSISSRSIFVSDDCDTTSSTLINMCAEDPLAITRSGTPASHRNSATPQPAEETNADRPVSRSRVNNTRHLNYGSRKRNSTGGASGAGSGKSSTLQPIVCLEKLNCSSMRTRSSSRTPVKTYKRSIFTSALVNSSGIPLKRKKKKKHKLNGTSSSGGASSPSGSEDLNSASSSLEGEEPAPATTVNNGTEGTSPRHRANKGRPQTPSPLKFSPRKLRKPRGRWYRER